MNSATFVAQSGSLVNTTTLIKWKTRRKIMANKKSAIMVVKKNWAVIVKKVLRLMVMRLT